MSNFVNDPRFVSTLAEKDVLCLWVTEAQMIEVRHCWSETLAKFENKQAKFASGPVGGFGKRRAELESYRLVVIGGNVLQPIVLDEDAATRELGREEGRVEGEARGRAEGEARGRVGSVIAILEARLSGARAFIHEAAGAAYEASARGKLDLDTRMRLRLATTWGMNEATEVSIACYRGAGTGAILDNQPFERRLRDALTASQHMQAMPGLIEMVGRHIIGNNKIVQYV